MPKTAVLTQEDRRTIRLLEQEAAKQGIPVYQLLDRLVEQEEVTHANPNN